VPHEMVVIVAAKNGRVGLVVDQVIGHHQTVIKTLSPLHRHVNSLGGATIMGDGSVALILDVATLVQLAEGMTAERLSA
jgi:two-component system, chemotaxis family, sensor kinase CheA